MQRIACCVLLIACCAARGNLAEALQHAQWKVRHVSTNSDDGLKLQFDAPKTDPTWTTTCTVIDTTGNDRAVTLELCIPLDATDAQWWDDPQTSRPISLPREAVAPEVHSAPFSTATPQQFSNLSDMAGGMDASASLYPMAVISHGDDAICVAVPIFPAHLPRFIYDPLHKQLRAEFDFGLSKLCDAYPSRADATVIAYSVPAHLAFRQALAKYYSLYPDAFQRRTQSAGLWLPFGDMQTIQHPEDFGFGFHEYGGDPISDPPGAAKSISADHAVGCRSYIYVEPPTYWQTFKGEGRGNFDQRLAQLKDEAAHGVKMAQATLTSGVIHADGQRDLYLEPVAYTLQAPWGNDADPHLPDDPVTHWQTIAHHKFDSLEIALGWRDQPPIQPSVGLDGVYIDSMEGWGELLDYNTDHWKYSVHPLTFDGKTHRVALLNFWGNYEFIKEMRDRLHAHNELLMGNDAYFRRWCLAPWVDIPGREYTWIENGKFVPLPDARFLFFRAMSYQRSYLMLMNNDFSDARAIEPYFQRDLFYAVYPSFFSANPPSARRPTSTNPPSTTATARSSKNTSPSSKNSTKPAGNRYPAPPPTTTPSASNATAHGTSEIWPSHFTTHPISRFRQDSNFPAPSSASVAMRLLLNGSRVKP